MDERRPPRLVVVAAFVAASVALIGFLTGTQDDTVSKPVSNAPLTETGPGAVPSYAMLGSGRRGVNASMYVGAFDRLREELPTLTSEVERIGDMAELRRIRASRRAFDGAPPTIPHAIDQRGYPACLACHELGAKVGDRIAPAMSHEPMSSCIQCHVPTSNPIDLGTWSVANRFVGLPSPGAGTSASEGAPPTIPHTTAMRERCMSCHGVSGASPIRTSHPWRQSCNQCHVPRALEIARESFPLLRGKQ